MTTAEQVSESRRNEAWFDYLEVVRLERYYYKLYDRYQVWRQAIRFLIFLSVSGNVVGTLQGAPSWVIWSVSTVAAILLAVDFLGDHARKAASSFAISQACAALCNDYSRLWQQINEREIDELQVVSRLEELAESVRRTTGRAGDVDLRTNERLNERSTVEANQLLESRYVVQEA